MIKRFFIKAKDVLSDGADVLADFFEELLDLLLDIMEAIDDK